MQLKLGSMQPMTEGPGLGVNMCSITAGNWWKGPPCISAFHQPVCKLTQNKIVTEIYCILPLVVYTKYSVLLAHELPVWSLNFSINQVIFNAMHIILKNNNNDPQVVLVLLCQCGGFCKLVDC